MFISESLPWGLFVALHTFLIEMIHRMSYENLNGQLKVQKRTKADQLGHLQVQVSIWRWSIFAQRMLHVYRQGGSRE